MPHLATTLTLNSSEIANLSAAALQLAADIAHTIADHWLTVLAWTATIVGIASSVPQAWRHRRTRTIAGTPLSTISTQIVGATWWLVYEISAGAWPAAAASTVWLATVVVSLGVVWPQSTIREQRRNTAGTVAGLMAAAVFAVSSPSAAGVAAAAVGIGRLVPVIGAMWRQRRRGLHGVAPAAWLLGALQAALWAGYGAATGLVTLAVSSVIYLAASGGVLALLWSARSSDGEPAPA